MIEHVIDNADKRGHRHSLHLLQDPVQHISLTLRSLIVITCRVTDTAVGKRLQSIQGLRTGLCHFYDLLSGHLGSFRLITIDPLDLLRLYINLETADGIHHICHYVKVYGYVILDIQVQILVQHADGTCGAAKEITLRSLPVFTVGIIQIRITVNRQQFDIFCLVIDACHHESITMRIDGELSFTGVYTIKCNVRITVGYFRFFFLHFFVNDHITGFDIYLLHFIQFGEDIETSCKDYQYQYFQYKKQLSVTLFLFLRRHLSGIRSSLTVLIIRIRSALAAVSPLLARLSITRSRLPTVLSIPRIPLRSALWSALWSALTILIRIGAISILTVLAIRSLLITILTCVGISLLRMTIRAIVLTVWCSLLVISSVSFLICRCIILAVFCCFSLISSL